MIIITPWLIGRAIVVLVVIGLFAWFVFELRPKLVWLERFFLLVAFISLIGLFAALITSSFASPPKPSPVIPYCITSSGSFFPCSEVKRAYNI